MNFNGFNLNDINWKKIVKIGFLLLVGIMIIQMYVLGLVFNKTRKFVNEFNHNFDRSQQLIHNKIEDEQRDFEERAAAFDRTHERIGRGIQESMDDTQRRMNIKTNHETALAEDVEIAKKNYESKLAECQEDQECRKNLNQ